MAVTLEVPVLVLQAAALEWDDAGDTLDGAWRRLDKASTADLSPEVAAAVQAFQTSWADEIKACGQRAQRCSEALTDSLQHFTSLDEAEAERLRGMLPWAYRTARILTV